MPKILFPEFKRNRGVGFWLRPGNWWAARRKFLRFDYSVDWRDGFESIEQKSSTRTERFSTLHGRESESAFRFLILGDTGEGDRSQYGLLPMIRALRPDFLVINGDVAYPAGNIEDFIEGFFEPYQSLKIPIWAVPGNHEYYSRDNGRTFFELFCTDRMASLWESYGLPFRRQPGTYWELGDTGGSHRLVLIGVDSLKSANLDGDGGKRADKQQLEWLTWRLDLAEAESRAVILMFHIPALVGEKHEGKTHLQTLHRLIASHSCVKLVVSGHEHNFQSYSAATFERYLNAVLPAGEAAVSCPRYMVSGGGGAYLASTAFPAGGFPAESVYPCEKQWAEQATRGQRAVKRMGFEKWAVGRLAGRFSLGVHEDEDAARFLSFLAIDVAKNGDTRVSPVFLDDLERLFHHLPDDYVVDVLGEETPDPDAVRDCIQEKLSFTL